MWELDKDSGMVPSQPRLPPPYFEMPTTPPPGFPAAEFPETDWAAHMSISKGKGKGKGKSRHLDKGKDEGKGKAKDKGRDQAKGQAQLQPPAIRRSRT